ncbi:hypothetical protein Tco_0791193 [Tanacetum coccineum]
MLSISSIPGNLHRNQKLAGSPVSVTLVQDRPPNNDLQSKFEARQGSMEFEPLHKFLFIPKIYQVGRGCGNLVSKKGALGPLSPSVLGLSLLKK